MNQHEQKKSQFAAMEEEVLAFWNEHKCFEQSVNMRPVDKQYVFYDGPPFATGLPHYGHIVASLIKDIVPRHWTMRGFRVERRWGWDCHGLPLENIIEQELGLSGRKDIEQYGVAKFNEACRSTVLKYADEWKKIIPRMGRWVDMENDYKTMDTSYTESVWWVFSELWKKGLIYEGKKAMHVCPRCVTVLSNFEVTQGYKDTNDLSVIAKFPITDEKFVAEHCGGEPTSFVAWTTTPWSIPTTMGLAVGPGFTYVLLRAGDQQVICAKDRLEYVAKHLPTYNVVKEFKGSDIVGVAYEHPFPQYAALPEVHSNPNVYKTHATDYVSVEDGTGIVTINGAFGEIDMESANRIGLPIVVNVKMDGTYTEEMGELAGQSVKPAANPREMDKKIADVLEAAGFLWRADEYTHSYPHCWRCDTPLLNYATSSWFVKVSVIKEQLLANNQQIHWVPEHIKDGRFGKWLENARDWAISRSRFWGAPLPMWKSDDGDVICVSSVAELEELVGQPITDVHMHIIDQLPVVKNGKTYRRIPEVLDCWFESGSMPYGQMHYPFENKQLFEQNFPAQFIAEGQDQTRGWFYTLHILATALTMGEQPSIPSTASHPAFQNVIVNGIVLAEDGKKMSKRLKNYPDPMEVVQRYSADALRIYLASSPVMEAENLNFSEKDVDELHRKYVNTLWNVFTFYSLFAQKETRPVEQIHDPSEVRHVMDKWILGLSQQLITRTTQGYETYHLRETALPLVEFVQELSTWYVRRSRARFKSEDAEDRLLALRTLYTVLKVCAQVAAPVTPFIAEKIYRALRAQDDPVSVHHCDWPTANPACVNEEVLANMQRVREAIEKALALRAEAGVKVRQPLQSVTVAGEPMLKEYSDVIKDELNVKEVRFGSEFALDTVMTEELKLEGVVRELVRQTNALRKQARFTLGDMIDVQMYTESELVRKALAVHGAEYQKSVLAKSFQFVTEPQAHQVNVEGEQVTLSF